MSQSNLEPVGVQLVAQKRPPAQVEYELIVPIEVGGVERKKLTIRRPKVRDLKAAYDQHGEGMRAELKLLGDVTELAPNEIDELDMADLQGAQAILASFRVARSTP